ncbi:hypothetical protein F751_6166 [Auxenochlorella protothecoides]|uniref:Uncharacterized protein n=1 Tax=Auxenochlorella protothecoides TaxID=3075 RepID=A0A087SHK7_AUXPR|nr:hypothetical protein F751_6166 [Auxenochlorella protothecoides]KFM25211.1 hypothetical protein F751_6166 [Auxenochlorella protothecoides]
MARRRPGPGCPARPAQRAQRRRAPPAAPARPPRVRAPYPECGSPGPRGRRSRSLAASPPPHPLGASRLHAAKGGEGGEVKKGRGLQEVEMKTLGAMHGFLGLRVWLGCAVSSCSFGGTRNGEQILGASLRMHPVGHFQETQRGNILMQGLLVR